MNKSYANFQAQVNDDDSVDSQGDQKRQVNENLLEIEAMLKYLRNETETLKSKNSELGLEVKELEQSNRVLRLHTESVAVSGTMSSRQIEQLQRELVILKHEVKKRKRENLELKKELKNQYKSHQNELVELNDDFDEIINSRAIEMAVLKEEMLSSRCERSQRKT